MKRILEFVWPLVGVVAVVWSLVQLYTKLSHEVSLDDNVAAMLVEGSLFNNIGVIAGVIGHKIGDIPALSFTLAGISSLVAYAALAWYDGSRFCILAKRRGFRGLISPRVPLLPTLYHIISGLRCSLVRRFATVPILPKV